MDRSIEERIVNGFFNKRCRERILYELKSDKNEIAFLTE